MAVPALGVYGPELFPTAARGAANGVINLAAVVGSAVGLLLAGVLSDRFDGLGPAMAVLSVGGIVVVVLVLSSTPRRRRSSSRTSTPHDAPAGPRAARASRASTPSSRPSASRSAADEGLGSPARRRPGRTSRRDPEDQGRDR